MKIYVCVKHVPDSAARIRIVPPNEFEEKMAYIINPYDENAVEEAVRLKKECDGAAEVIAVTVGKPKAGETLRTVMAMGADRGIHVVTEAFPDAMTTAAALSEAILPDGSPDLIFTGRLSIDAEGGEVMFRLAETMGLPVLSNVIKFDFAADADGKIALVERDAGGGRVEVYRMPVPCVIGAGKGLNTPRYPRLPDIMAARKKPIKTLAIRDLFGGGTPKAGVELTGLQPAVEKRKGRALTGTPAEMVKELVNILKHRENIL